MSSKIEFEQKITYYRMERVVNRTKIEMPMKVYLTVEANTEREKISPKTVKEAHEKWNEIFAIMLAYSYGSSTRDLMLEDIFPKCKKFVEENMRRWCEGATRVTFIVSVEFDDARSERAGDFVIKEKDVTYTQFDNVRDMPIMV